MVERLECDICGLAGCLEREGLAGHRLDPLRRLGSCGLERGNIDGWRFAKLRALIVIEVETDAGFWELTGEHDAARLDYGVNHMLQWYLGDGTYGDGKAYHWDYYNSYVIQPMLLDIVRVCEAKNDPLKKHLKTGTPRGAQANCYFCSLATSGDL